MRVGELKKFLEATDDEVLVNLEVLLDGKTICVTADTVQDDEVGSIVLVSYLKK
jgi:hypothetical protein